MLLLILHVFFKERSMGICLFPTAASHHPNFYPIAWLYLKTKLAYPFPDDFKDFIAVKVTLIRNSSGLFNLFGFSDKSLKNSPVTWYLIQPFFGQTPVERRPL
jgi:hypothetical protein